MLDIGRFKHSSSAPSRQSLEKTCTVLSSSLAEMKIIVNKLSDEKKQLPDTDKYRLLYLGSCLYDFYLLVEDCLLHIARITDRWVPASLDWRERLIKLLENPVSDKRPQVLSTGTAALLADYLSLYLNFHHQCSSLSSSRIKKMIDNLDQLYIQLEKELTYMTRLFMPGRQA